MMHVFNGDSMSPIFAASGMPGTPVVYADALLEGPVPEGLSDEAMLRLRQAFWRGPDPPEQQADEKGVLAQWQRNLDSFSGHDEVILWFEHDLFDQLLLIRHLDWFARRRGGPRTFSLICVGSFAGIEPFKGLGQLTPDQLMSLLDTRAAITQAQFDLAQRAWAAFTAADPRFIEQLLAGDTSALPFLAPALRRWLEEFPAVRSGLPRSEREILTLLLDAPRSTWSLFHEWARREDALCPTDTALAGALDRLTSSSPPLVRVDANAPADPASVRSRMALPRGTVAITDTGRDVLAGRTDWLDLRPVDRWMGGVHLTNASMWRWDSAEARIVPR